MNEYGGDGEKGECKLRLRKGPGQKVGNPRCEEGCALSRETHGFW